MAERKVVRGEYFDLHFGLAAAEGRARLGLIVPKRLARTATLRNSIKRQGREAFRLCSGQVPACDLVLRLKRPFVGISPTDELQRKAWRKEIEILFGRLSTKSL